MARTLPEQIVAAVTELAEDLAGWCAAGRDQPLAAHEQAVLERVRQVLPALLGAVIAAGTSGLGLGAETLRSSAAFCSVRSAAFIAAAVAPPRPVPRPVP